MAQQTQKEEKPRLQQMIDIAVETAEAKGWSTEVECADQKKLRYATVSVERYFGGTAGHISAQIELTCHEKVHAQVQPTSFHRNGLRALQEAILAEIRKLPWVVPASSEEAKASKLSSISILEGVFRRFHRSVRQLKHRHADRQSLDLQDEYDVQDYLHAILRVLFDDIRAEEYTPSYAGGASRIDFLIKSESIAIEVKMANASLRDRKVGEQLLIDVQRYQAHPGCKTLFCFVYDPSGYILNPVGLEADLTKKYDELDVRVIVVSPS